MDARSGRFESYFAFCLLVGAIVGGVVGGVAGVSLLTAGVIAALKLKKYVYFISKILITTVIIFQLITSVIIFQLTDSV